MLKRRASRLAEYLGFVGGLLTTFSVLPQVIRIFRIRSAREISILFTIFLLVGGATWLFYGIFLELTPVILWNAIGVCMSSSLLYAKLRYGLNQKE
jgi:MtN3 and saliva related transmembrane protein